MRLVQEDEAVDPRHGGVDRAHARSRSVAAEQEPRAVHRQRAQDHRRLRRVRGRPRRDSSAQPNHIERRRGRIGGEGAEALGDCGDHLACVRCTVDRAGIRERPRKPVGVVRGGVHQQAPVDDPPDTGWRRSVRRLPIRLRREPPHRDIQARGLAQSGRNADLRRPLVRFGHLLGQPLLPREGRTPVDGPVEGSKARCGRRHRSIAIVTARQGRPASGTQSPKPRCRPEPITIGPGIARSNRISTWE